MSEIFNVILWNNNQIEHIYIFLGKQINIEGLTIQNLGPDDMNIIDRTLLGKIRTENIRYTFISESIYGDDTILRLKEKIVKYTELNSTLPEIYLFTLVKTKINATILFNKLTQDGMIELTKDMLEVFLKNINKNNVHDTEKYNLLDHVNNIKGFYTYSDFMNMRNIDFSNIILKKSLGLDIIFNKKYPFVVNPYQIDNMDSFILNEQVSIMSQNKNLLFDYGNAINNSIYVSLAPDILNFYKETSITNNYLLKKYFSQLFLNYQVKTIEDIERNRSNIKDENVERMQKIKKFEEKLYLLNELNLKYKDQLQTIDSGISNIYLTLHPTKNINVPLETIFKIIHTNETVPFIKFNAGSGMVNIYRLYTGENIATNGKKIPKLYIDYNKRKTKLIKLTKLLAYKKRIGFYIKNKGELNEIYCEFLENGNIDIRLNILKATMRGKTISESIIEIERMIQNSVNNYIISKINSFTSDIGYEFSQFTNLSDENVEINNIDYFISVKNSKSSDLKNFMGCVFPIVNINQDITASNKDEINLTYKRVSSFQEMTSINAFITILQRQNVSMTDILDKLINNYQLSKEKATEMFSNWQSNIHLQAEQFENKKISIKDNPGFEIIMKQKVDDIGFGFENIFHVVVKNINNINYIRYIEKYINSILILITDVSETIEDKEIEKCKIEKKIELVVDGKMEDHELTIDELLDLRSKQGFDSEDALEILSMEEESDGGLIDSDLSDFYESEEESEDESEDEEEIGVSKRTDVGNKLGLSVIA